MVQAAAGERPAAEPRVPMFHKAFLKSIRSYGRTFELGMIGDYKMASGDLFGDFKLGLTLFRKGKLRLLPKSVDDIKSVRRVFDRSELKK